MLSWKLILNSKISDCESKFTEVIKVKNNIDNTHWIIKYLLKIDPG